ncbi:MAG TPA: TIGR01906 family membrane protein [Tissierellaceae bacterium]|nr:TIGR01906 family membrane protein [Tissierellaceae bacterium]
MKKIFSIILIISISLSCLAFSIELNSYNKDFYIKSYKKYEVPKITNKSIEDLSEITDDIISYLKNSGGDELLSKHFNEKEVLHMRDVQNLFNISRWVKIIGLIVSGMILYYFYRKKEYISLGKTLFIGLFINHILFGILAILASIDFNRYFTYFHLLFFSNDLWILNPKTDLMIQMLPEEFFMNIAFRIVLSFFILLAILQIVGYLFIKKGRDRNANHIKKNERLFYRKK